MAQVFKLVIKDRIETTEHRVLRLQTTAYSGTAPMIYGIGSKQNGSARLPLVHPLARCHFSRLTYSLILLHRLRYGSHSRQKRHKEALVYLHDSTRSWKILQSAQCRPPHHKVRIGQDRFLVKLRKLHIYSQLMTVAHRYMAK